MSSNKIGFFTALGLYVPIIMAIALLDLKINIIGEAGKSKAFSIRLENISDKDLQDSTKKPKKSQNPQTPQNLKNPQIPQKSQNPQNPPQNKPFLQDSALNAQESQSINIISSQNTATNAESSVESNAESSTKNQSINSKSQSTIGEYDLYLIEIIRIINQYHAKEPIKNLYGTVGIAFSINPQGAIENLIITKSSGNARLDSIALKTIRRASIAFPNPKQTYHIKTTLAYKR